MSRAAALTTKRADRACRRSTDLFRGFRDTCGERAGDVTGLARQLGLRAYRRIVLPLLRAPCVRRVRKERQHAVERRGDLVVSPGTLCALREAREHLAFVVERQLFDDR